MIRLRTQPMRRMVAGWQDASGRPDEGQLSELSKDDSSDPVRHIGTQWFWNAAFTYHVRKSCVPLGDLVVNAQGYRCIRER